MLPIDKVISPGRSVQLMEVLLATLVICLLAPIEIANDSLIPISLQTLLVLVIPAFLGIKRGSGAVLLYLLAGFAGAPVFAEGSAGIEKLWGPTGGFLIAFWGAAIWIGKKAEQAPWISFGSYLGRFLAGHLMILIPGFIWLGFYLESFGQIPDMILPLIPGLLVKTGLAAFMVWGGNLLLKRLGEKGNPDAV